MSPIDLYEFLKQPKLKKVRYILNSGGEITLQPNLKPFIYYEHKALPKATIQLSTNALLPKVIRDTVIFAIDVGVPKIDVGLSIDGIGDKHDEIRGVKGNFVKLCQTICLLKDLQKEYPQVSIGMGSTLTSKTAEYAEELYNFSKAKNIPFMWHWYNQSSFYENSEDSPSVKVQCVVGLLPEKYIYNRLWQKQLNDGSDTPFKCFALKTFFAIKCNGDIVPCLTHWDKVVGNIKTQTFKEIFSSQTAKNKIYNIKTCEGCLNSWGFGWSLQSRYHIKVMNRIKQKIMEKIR